MNPEQAAAVLTYINQIDPLVQINGVNADVWWEALQRYSHEQALWCAKHYYANTKPAWNGKVPPLTPAMLKASINEQQERAENKRRSLEPPLNKAATPEHFRSRNPGKYDQLFAQAGLDHIRDLEARGIQLHPWQQNRTSESTRGVAPF